MFDVVFCFLQRSSHQALDLHGDKGEQTLGHLVQRASGHPQRFHSLRPGALGLRHSRSGENPQLHAGVALLYVQVCNTGKNITLFSLKNIKFEFCDALKRTQIRIFSFFSVL